MAASNIEGNTLHSAFHFDFSHIYKSLSDKKRDELRNYFKNVQVVIIDEFSMMKNFQLYQLHLRLCDVKQTDQIMGGVAVFLVGDPMQLKPIRGDFIFQPPKYGNLKEVHSVFNLWEEFGSICLKQNHRQGKDKVYAEVLNKIRFKNDMKLLKTRISMPEDDENITKIFGRNEEVNKVNDTRLNTLNTSLFTIDAVHSPVRKNLKVTDAGTIEQTAFLQTLKIKVGARVMLLHNISTLDGLTNGAQGKVEDIILKNEKVQYILIRFDNPNIGQEQRRKFWFIPSVARSGNLTPIEKHNLSYTLGDIKKDHGARASFLQFPLKLSWALTAHKCQGQSIFSPNCIFTDLNETFQAAMAYVILSRVTSLDQLFLKEFDERKIYCNKEAKNEVARLEAKALNLKVTKWDEPDCGLVRFASLNTRSLLQHKEDLESDQFIMKSDIILIQETWLEYDLKNKISDFNHFYMHGHSKGIAVLTRSLPLHHSSFQTSNCSIIKLIFQDYDILNIYRFSSNTNIQEFTSEVLPLLNNFKTQVVAGDFNIDLQKIPNNSFTKSLSNLGYQQLVTKPTHNQGGQIDHVYFHSASGDSCKLFTHHTMFWSDHDCIAFLLNSEQTPDKEA